MNLRFSSEQLKAEACRLGFFACGIAQAGPVDAATADHYRQWIAQGGHADMHYLENNLEKRLDPTLLLPGARSIIVVAMSYAPARRLPEGEYQIADYALGKDYHDVLKQRLRKLGSGGAGGGLICVDTVPILERYWAWRAGLGFIGRNHQLIIPRAGSMFFLGEIVTTLEADHYDSPMPCRCGTCHRCIDACPTGALQSSDKGKVISDKYDYLDKSRDGNLQGNHTYHLSLFPYHLKNFDSRRCLSYQTIENRADIAESVKDKMGTTIYGCDRCQQACPWNRFATPTDVPELQPSERLLNMRRDDWHRLSRDDYQRLFKGSAVKRAKYEGLVRNIHEVAKHENTCK